jgi:hypothetical protein
VTNEAVYPLLAEPDLSEHTGFILAEEAALKEHLTGITVPGTPFSNPLKAKVPVKVWYRYPEGERQISYPFICIDFLSAEPAFDLFTSDYIEKAEGLYRPSISPTIPSPSAGWNRANWSIRNFLPFRLMFQVAHYARSNLHDRYLTSIFMTDILPVRPFWIKCQADDVWKRTENLGMASANAVETTESGTKRIFRRYYTISMLTEIPQDRFTEESEVYKVLRTLIPVVAMEEFDTYRKTFLDNQPDPLNDFTAEERAAGGEYFTIVHEGEEMTTAEDPPAVYGTGAYGEGPYGGTP